MKLNARGSASCCYSTWPSYVRIPETIRALRRSSYHQNSGDFSQTREVVRRHKVGTSTSSRPGHLDQPANPLLLYQEQPLVASMLSFIMTQQYLIERVHITTQPEVQDKSNIARDVAYVNRCADTSRSRITSDSRVWTGRHSNQEHAPKGKLSRSSGGLLSITLALQ